jgi:hypothetical protein
VLATTAMLQSQPGGNRTLTYGCYRIVLILHFVGLAVVLIITPKRIAQFFNDMALGLREMGWKGVLVVFACASGCCLREKMGCRKSLWS